MKLTEIKDLDTLTESEFVLLNEMEGFGEVIDIIKTDLGAPIKQMSTNINSMANSVGAKLKAWAMERTHFVKTHGYNDSVISKVINNPNGVAKQLIMNMLVKYGTQ